MRRRDLPNDRQSERDVLGAILCAPEQLDGLDLAVADFHDGQHQAIYGAMRRLHARGQPIDESTVAAEVTGATVDRKVLLAMRVETPVSAHAPTYAVAVHRAATARRAIIMGDELAQAGWAQDLDTVGELVAEAPKRLASPLDPVEPAVDALDLIDDDSLQDAKPWVIPGLLRLLERFVLSGREGAGKSSLLRQIAVCVAAGVHPFTLFAENMEAWPALVVDLQEDETDLQGAMRALTNLRCRSASGRPLRDLLAPGALRLRARPQGLNLLEQADQRWLEGLIAQHRPSLLVIGPVRKLTRAHGTWAKSSEEATDELTRFLDDLRIRYQFALLMEAHAGHDRDDYRPRGSSVWLDWPEFGHGLKPINTDDPSDRTSDVVRWRGDRHAGRPWPWRLWEDTPVKPWRCSEAVYAEMLRVMGLSWLLGEPDPLDIGEGGIRL